MRFVFVLLLALPCQAQDLQRTAPQVPGIGGKLAGAVDPMIEDRPRTPRLPGPRPPMLLAPEGRPKTPIHFAKSNIGRGIQIALVPEDRPNTPRVPGGTATLPGGGIECPEGRPRTPNVLQGGRGTTLSREE